MSFKYTMYGLFLCSIVSMTTYGLPGCMDNSYHLTRACDDKSYHYVACNCPCVKQLPAVRNMCIKCGHYHEGKPLVFGSRSAAATVSCVVGNRTCCDAEQALMSCVRRYQKGL
jgi:hypothetical protein